MDLIFFIDTPKVEFNYIVKSIPALSRRRSNYRTTHNVSFKFVVFILYILSSAKLILMQTSRLHNFWNDLQNSGLQSDHRGM